jgi:hypothetical protein
MVGIQIVPWERRVPREPREAFIGDAAISLRDVRTRFERLKAYLG